METRIELEGGKYTYVCDNNGKQEALRYGEPWRDLAGDKFVYCLAYRANELQEQNKSLVEALKRAMDEAIFPSKAISDIYEVCQSLVDGGSK